MRASLLTTTAAAALLAAMPARAQDATWQLNPGTADYNTAANWTPATVPTGTAFFGATSVPNLTFSSAATIVGGWTFNAGAPAYTFTLGANALFFNGAGIVINAGSATISTLSSVNFLGSSSAGSAVINAANSAVIGFNGTSTAANAVINNAGRVSLGDQAGLGSATIANTGLVSFQIQSRGDNATINNGAFGAVSFFDTSTAGNATITNNNSSSSVRFMNSSSAGNGVLMNNLGLLSFADTSTAGNAAITNDGFLQFIDTSTGGNATITTASSGVTRFAGNSTAGQARLIANAGGSVDFSLNTGPNPTAGSIEGAGSYLLGSKTLTVGGNNLSTTVSGPISDGGAGGGTGGSLVKVGTGTLTLAGTSSYTGSTTINAGTLLVTGDISSSSGVTVNPGGMLTVTGTAPGITINGGILAPGPPDAVGTLNVRGNLVLTSATTYLVNINAVTASLTNVTGTATLGGATVQVGDGSDITKRKVYTLLTASGGIIGTFNPEVANAKKKVDLFYDANNVYLCDHCKFDSNVQPGPPGIPTQLPADISNVVGAIDAAIDADVTLPARFQNLRGLSRQQFVNALTQLTGENHTGAQQAGFQVMNGFLRLLLDPFADTRAVGGTSSAIGFAPERAAALPPDVALAYASVLKAPAAPAQPTVPLRPWNIWASGYGGRANISGDPLTIGSHDTSVRDYGYAAGLDYRIAPDTTVGFALGGAGTDWSLASGLGGGRSDVFQAGLYGSKRWGAAYVSAALAYATYWMSTDRFVNVFGTDHLTSNFTAHNFAGRIESGYRFAVPMVAVTPYGAFQAQRLSLPAYGEIAPSGSSIFALTYSGQTASTTRSELGAWFDRTVLVGYAGAATLFARAAWAHDWGNDRAVSTNFLTLPTPAFVINGAAPPPDKALVSAGSELRLGNGWSVTGKFDGEFATRLQSYAGTGIVRYAW
jgi:autotransporter-associated beta strand protein